MSVVPRLPAGGRGTTTINMNSGTPWTATWDSSIAGPGTVYYSMRAASPPAAEDGEFALTANLANPGP